jgi:hypothetical protein
MPKADSSPDSVRGFPEWEANTAAPLCNSSIFSSAPAVEDVQYAWEPTNAETRRGDAHA